MKSFRTHRIAALSLTLTFGAGLALADEAKTERGWSKQETHQKMLQKSDAEKAKPILAGPKVEDDADVEAQVSRMGEQMRAVQRSTIGPLVWMRTVRSLDLTQEQTKAIDSIVESFRTANRAFQEEHGEQLEALRSSFRKARQAEDADRMQEVRNTLREVRGNAPSPQEVQGAIWELLSEEQRDEFRLRMVQLQEQRERRTRGRLREGRDGRMSIERVSEEQREVVRDRILERRPQMRERLERRHGENGRPIDRKRRRGLVRPQ